jgi:hypothetical protein
MMSGWILLHNPILQALTVFGQRPWAAQKQKQPDSPDRPSELVMLIRMSDDRGRPPREHGTVGSELMN